MRSLLLNIVVLVPFILVQGADLDWWKTAIFYQIYPRSFKDSDNSGTGDIGGIIQKLDHLVDIGITAIWLSPIYKSPQVDHGYDISDFRDVDPLFGNLTILKELVNKCHATGIKVILDFVPNHSSDEHAWFNKSELNDTEYANYYVWKNAKPDGSPPNNWISYFHGSAWTFSEKRGQYYLHQFAKGQPDLNYREPKVVEQMKNVLIYWLTFGIDGFRMDIVPALYERADFADEPRSNATGVTPNDHGYLSHIYTTDQPETYDMVHQWRILLDNYQAQKGGDARVMMIETYSPDDKALQFYGNSSQLGAHFPFNFWFITKLDKNSTAVDIKTVIDKWLNFTEIHNYTANWVAFYFQDTIEVKLYKNSTAVDIKTVIDKWSNFTQLHNYTANWVLGNHDQHRVASRYGTDRIEGLAMLTLMLPGIGVIYNGEEIGMEDGEVTWTQGEDPQACNGAFEDFDKNSRDFQRTPYQWDDTVNAGFNEGAKTWLPVSSKYKTLNRKSQIINGLKSYYRIYQALIKARKHDTLKYGKTETVTLTNNVIGVVRRYADNPTYLILVNVGNVQEYVNLTSINVLPDIFTVNITSVHSRRSVGEVIQVKSITLDPYESLVLIGKNEIEGNGTVTNTTGTPVNNNGNSAATSFSFLFMIAFITGIFLSNI